MRHGLQNILKLILISLVLGCRPAPTYNPFDAVFDVQFTKSELVQLDTIWVECGYRNLSKDLGDHQIYYQYYLKEPGVVAKGFEVIFDTIHLALSIDQLPEDSLLWVISTKPIDTLKLNRIMHSYGLNPSSSQQGDLHYSHYKDPNDKIIKLFVDFYPTEGGLGIVRRASYFITPEWYNKTNQL